MAGERGCRLVEVLAVAALAGQLAARRRHARGWRDRWGRGGPVAGVGGEKGAPGVGDLLELGGAARRPARRQQLLQLRARLGRGAVGPADEIEEALLVERM